MIFEKKETGPFVLKTEELLLHNIDEATSHRRFINLWMFVKNIERISL